MITYIMKKMIIELAYYYLENVKIIMVDLFYSLMVKHIVYINSYQQIEI